MKFKLLENPAKVGNTVFEKGVPEFLVIQRAELEYEASFLGPRHIHVPVDLLERIVKGLESTGEDDDLYDAASWIRDKNGLKALLNSSKERL